MVLAKQHCCDCFVLRNDPCADLSALLKRVGRAVALLHDGSLVHGDLTTSNILVRNTDHAVVGCK